MMIGGYLADELGWRRAFFVVGLPGVLLAMVVALVIRDSARPVHVTPDPLADLSTSLRQSLTQVLGSRAYVLLLCAGSAASFLSYGKATWTTIFFQRTHQLTPSEVGFYFGLFGGIAGIAGTLLGGWLADRFGCVNRRHVLTAPAIGMVLAAPLAFVAYFAVRWEVALALLMVPTLLNSLYYGPTYSSVQGLVPLRSRAIASALLLFGQNLIGLGLGPLFFGMLSDLLKPAYGEDSVRYVLFGAAWLGLVPAYFFWRCSLRLNAELDRQG